MRPRPTNASSGHAGPAPCGPKRRRMRDHPTGTNATRATRATARATPPSAPLSRHGHSGPGVPVIERFSAPFPGAASHPKLRPSGPTDVPWSPPMAATERTNTAPTQVPAFTDARLDRVRALVERGSVKVLSLDVFDTLVWRVVPEPVDAFPLLGTHLRRLGHLRPATSPELFGTLREGAEWRARRLAGERRDTLEVSLVEVYEQLPAHLFDGATPDELAALEVDFEREITFPDLDVLAVARWAQEEHGVRVVCVSDTYYSEDQLAYILDREPISTLGIERVFTSSVRGMGKGSGLYDA